MMFSVLQGLDLDHANTKGTPPTNKAGRQNSDSKTNSRLRIRRNGNVDIVADEILDEDLICTPPLDATNPASSHLSNNKRQFSEVNVTVQGINGEDVEMMSERRRALFEPLGPNGVRAVDNFLPPPDFDAASYPQGWVTGKKRKLVNVDVVESMRRIAVQEMNRKDREIDGLNEQLEEDARTMEHLQSELQQERQKRLQAEREKSTLQAQADMLMTMLNELEDDGETEQLDDCQVINN